jgi:rhodanese-related sulfurtransferase
MKKLLLLSLILSTAFAQSNDDTLIKITNSISAISTNDSGKKILIKRVQDPQHRLTDDYTKTSRPCPPFCIQPIKVNPNIDTIAELEVLAFMQKKMVTNEGLLIDARLKSWFELETIPSAINLPFPIIVNAKKEKIEHIFQLLGMRVETKEKWSFKNAKELTIFDNGVWCSQASRLISALLKNHYPSSKIHYYRSGFQGWKLLGLTTVVHKEITKE